MTEISCDLCSASWRLGWNLTRGIIVFIVGSESEKRIVSYYCYELRRKIVAVLEKTAMKNIV